MQLCVDQLYNDRYGINETHSLTHDMSIAWPCSVDAGVLFQV